MIEAAPRSSRRQDYGNSASKSQEARRSQA